MELALVALATIVGIIAGVFCIDMRSRLKAMLDIKTMNEDQKDRIESLMKLHNATVAKNLEISERLQSLEMMLKGRDQQKPLVRQF